MTSFAMVFPGQGSQKVGMLTDLAKNYPIVRTTFNEASSILHYDLWKLVQYGPSEKLNRTYVTQPALLAASVAIWRIWKAKRGKMPTFMGGHSLGEYSALVCADSLNFFDAISLVALRGKIMQKAFPAGTCAMSAIIGLKSNLIMTICKEASQEQIVSPANFNAPDQIVIAGHKEAVERACSACKKAGAKRIVLLPISVPSHCALMKPAAEELAKKLNTITFSTPKIPVINNVDIRIEKDPKDICQALIRQLYNPIYWTKVVEYLSLQGVEILLEIGPGKVLTNLTKRIVKTLLSVAVNDSNSLIKTIKQENFGDKITNESKRKNCAGNRF
ncbi:ACP S-malonyltransferase [Sodalis sp. CWE]|nr:ACP S-malonyltransferase [Sodalis sp. CWE]